MKKLKTSDEVKKTDRGNKSNIRLYKRIWEWQEERKE